MQKQRIRAVGTPLVIGAAIGLVFAGGCARDATERTTAQPPGPPTTSAPGSSIPSTLRGGGAPQGAPNAPAGTPNPQPGMAGVPR